MSWNCETGVPLWPTSSLRKSESVITNEELAAELKNVREQLNELRAFIQGRSDSVELSKTSTGKYSWSVKVYNNDEAIAIEKVRRTETALAKFYGGE